MNLKPLICLMLPTLLFGQSPRKKPKPAKGKSASQPETKTICTLPLAGACGELLNMTTGENVALGHMLESRSDYQATAMLDGRVLITGGSYEPTTEWLDGRTGQFSRGPAMVKARQGHCALRLKDGSLLLLGGTEEACSAEILEPGQNAFKSILPDVKFGFSAQALELDKGILMVDGPSGRAWLKDGAKCKAVGELKDKRQFFQMTRVADHRVLITGGWPAKPSQKGDIGIECFDPSKSKWTRWKSTPLPRGRHQAILMDASHVALMGGMEPTAQKSVDAVEILDIQKAEISDKTPTSPDTMGACLQIKDESIRLGEKKRFIETLNGHRKWALANAYDAPLLVALPEHILVMGSPAWGPPLERWDARTRQLQPFGSLRHGAEKLVLLGRQVLAVGDIVDEVDLKTGKLKPLGRRNEWEARLTKAIQPVDGPKLKGLGLKENTLALTLRDGSVLVWPNP